MNKMHNNICNYFFLLLFFQGLKQQLWKEVGSIKKEGEKKGKGEKGLNGNGRK